MADNLGFTSSNPYLGKENPYLQQNIDSTMGDITRNYNLAVKPQTASMKAGSGSFGNSGLQQLETERQRQLADTLGKTAGGMRMQRLFLPTGLVLRKRSKKRKRNQKSRIEKTKGPRIRGVRGPKSLNVVKAPAQGGEAGDSACYLVVKINESSRSSVPLKNFLLS